MNEVSTAALTAASAESLRFDRVWVPMCPTGCKRAAEPATHYVDHDGDGQAYVSHEVDFGDYAFGNVHEYLLVPRREASVTLSVEQKLNASPTPAYLSEAAAGALAAAQWLEARQ